MRPGKCKLGPGINLVPIPILLLIEYIGVPPESTSVSRIPSIYILRVVPSKVPSILYQFPVCNVVELFALTIDPIEGI
jgi:hypothetical protein